METSFAQIRTVSQICVRRVKVEGLKRTKNDIVVEQIKHVLKATSLVEVRKMSVVMTTTTFKVLLVTYFPLVSYINLV